MSDDSKGWSKVNNVNLVLGIITSLIAIGLFFGISSYQDLKALIGGENESAINKNELLNGKELNRLIRDDELELEYRKGATLNKDSISHYHSDKLTFKTKVSSILGKEIYFEGVVNQIIDFNTKYFKNKGITVLMDLPEPQFPLVDGELYSPGTAMKPSLKCTFKDKIDQRIIEGKRLTFKGMASDQLKYPYFRLEHCSLVENRKDILLRYKVNTKYKE